MQVDDDEQMDNYGWLKMSFFVIKIKNLKLLTIFMKSFILDVWLGSKYAFG